MVKNLCSLVFCFICLNGLAQLTNEGTPASWDINKEKSALMPIMLSSVDIQKIKSEDVINDKIRSKPYRIGVSHKVNYGLGNSGKWTELENGDRIWQIGFNSKDALNLSVNFDKFFLPEGATIYMYNDARSDLLGAYTSSNNNNKRMLGSWFVKGERVWVEYYEPKEVVDQGVLNITSVIHGYRLENEYQKGYLSEANQKINESGDCNQDVDCPIGADFEAQKDLLKKSVAFLNMGDGFICSGTLVNNTNEDNTPFFLTADHCFERSSGEANPSLFSMRFNWISPNPDCATTAGSTNGPTNFVMTGSVERARNSGSDVALVEINNPIPGGWDVTYAGWDRSDAIPSFQVGIHHPSGDIMKICRDDDAASKVSQFGVETWDINRLTQSGNSGNATGWELGVTEGGSSGSALFDQNGRIIGQLLGGLAACGAINTTVDNNAHDYYGRFATSWNAGGTPATQLQDWLDPAGTNPMTLDTKQNILAVNDEFLEDNISVYPNPTTGTLQVKSSGLVGELSYEVFNVLGQLLKSDTLVDTINLSSLSDNIYFVKIIEIDSKKIIVKKIVLSK